MIRGRTSTIVIEQVLNGFPLPQDEPIRCSDCGARLTEGQPISVLVERSATGERWYCPTLWGAGCAPAEADTTADVETALVEGELGALVDTDRQEHVPALIRPTVADYHSLRRVEA